MSRELSLLKPPQTKFSRILHLNVWAGTQVAESIKSQCNLLKFQRKRCHWKVPGVWTVRNPAFELQPSVFTFAYPRWPKRGRTIEIRTPNHKHRYILERANEGTSIERPSSSGNDFSKKSAGKYRWLHIWPRMRKSSGSCFLSSGIGSSSPSIRGKSVLLCIIVLRNVVNFLHGTTTSISLMLEWLSAMHQINAR